MGSSYDLPAPHAFTAGAVGPPGQRVFYLQAADDERVVTLRCEKQQVAALAEYLASILGEREPHEAPAPPGGAELVEPLVEEWVVGPIGVAYDDDADRIILVLEELAEDQGARDRARVVLRLEPEQAAAFVSRSRQLVAAGRPLCALCGLPVDPDGHPCPRMN